jgi:mannitol/fructose-specific phosphotransferase system IIA component (Ntr-type)
MLLRDVFSAERIKVDLESELKDELFEEMVNVYVTASRDFADRGALLKALLDREALMSTGIKKGIAVPHGKTIAVQDVQGILGISRKGIDYEALDGQPVYLVFMLFSSPDASESHLRTLRKLAILLENPSFASELMQAKSAEGASQVLRRYEDLQTAIE